MTLVNAGIIETRDLIGNLSTPIGFKHLAWGTGAAAVTSSQTALGSEQDRQTANVSIVSVVAPFDTVRYHYTFDITTAASCKEIALFNATTAGDMLSREVLSTPISASKNGKLLVAFDYTIK